MMKVISMWKGWQREDESAYRFLVLAPLLAGFLIGFSLAMIIAMALWQ